MRMHRGKRGSHGKCNPGSRLFQAVVSQPGVSKLSDLCRSYAATSQEAYEMGCADTRADASAEAKRSVREQVDGAMVPLRAKIT